MIFVIDNLKYDTDKMDLISENCKYIYSSGLLKAGILAKEVKLWKSKKGRWLISYRTDFNSYCGHELSVEEVKQLLLKYDLDMYEKIFGELEEA